MFRDERLELAGQLRMLPDGEVGVDPILERRETQLSQPPDLVLGERVVPKIGERRPPPEPERLTETRFGLRRIHAPRLLHKSLEAGGVELRVLDPKRVARRMRYEHAVAERLTQARDVHLHVLRGSRRRPLPPQPVHERVDRHDLVAVQQQEGE